jgi:fibronectin-binding autotransporter adhesin
VGNAVTLAAVNSIFSPGTGGYTLSGVISGAAGNNFVKNGNNSLTVSGANDFLGDTFVNGGNGESNLIISNTNAFGAAASPHSVTITAGTLAGSNGSTNIFLRNLASNPGGVSTPTNVTLTMKTSGDFRAGLFSDNTQGATTWNGPINIIGDASTGDGNATFSCGSTTGGGVGAALIVNGDITGSAYTGFVSLRGNSGSPLGIMNGKITLPTAAKVNKNDSGTWIINSTGNTWGTTAIERGVLRLGVDNALPATVGISVNGAATAQFSTFDLNGKNQAIGGLVSAATLGTRSVANPTATLSVLTLNDTVDGTYGGISTITGNLAIVKSGSAVWTLGGSVANTHTGGTTVTAGTLKLAGTNSALGDATAPLTVNGGSVDVNGTSPTVGKLSGTGGTIVNDGAAASTLTFGDASNASFAGAIGGLASVSITKTGSGTQTLSGTSTYTGDTTVSAGTLDITGSHTTGANYSVASGADLITNNVRATGALTVNGTATINANGGSAGASKVEALAIDATGKLNLKDNDLIVGTAANVDVVRAAIKLGVAGAAGITSDTAGFGVSRGFGYALGNDANLSPSLAGSLTGQTYDADSVLVKYTFLGDADLDGDTDLNDLGLWASSFTGDLGNPVTPSTFWTSGDFDYDGDTDLNDLGLWSSTFTGDLGGGAGSLLVAAPNAPPEAVAILNNMGITVVPEPSTVSLFVLAGFGLLLRTKRKKLRNVRS